MRVAIVMFENDKARQGAHPAQMKVQLPLCSLDDLLASHIGNFVRLQFVDNKRSVMLRVVADFDQQVLAIPAPPILKQKY